MWALAPRLSSVAGCYGSSGLLAALVTFFRLLLLRLAGEPERFGGEGDLPLVGEGERLAVLPFLGGEVRPPSKRDGRMPAPFGS